MQSILINLFIFIAFTAILFFFFWFEKRRRKEILKSAFETTLKESVAKGIITQEQADAFRNNVE